MNVKQEVIAALTTFFTMSYILVINPSILGIIGVDEGAIFTATAISAGIACILMGYLSDRPFALASGMGLNAYFAYSVIGGMGFSYGAALAAVFFAGLLMLMLALAKVNLTNAAPESFKHALIGGLGLFLVFIGMQNAHFVTPNANTIVTLGNLTDPKALIAIIGFFITSYLLVKNRNGALFIGMFAAAILAMLLGLTPLPEGIVQWPPSMQTSMLKVDFGAILNPRLLSVVWTFFIIGFFDVLGVITALGNNPRFWSKDDEKTANQNAVITDSLSTMFGSLVGVSSIIIFLESASGIKAGGKTGLTAIIVGALFILSLFFFPLIKSIPVEAAAPAIIIVGLMMVSGIGNIKYDDQTESIPALLTLGTIPFTFSIADGIGVGAISFVFLKLVTGRYREIHPAMYVIGFLSVLHFATVF
jgi:AGZA family xanthine/uracil permease-like MFS transporter